MVIDAHAHLGFNDIIRGTAEDLLLSMDRAGIEQAIVLPGAVNDCPTERLLAAVAPHRDRLYALGTVSPLEPDRPDVATVRRWLADGLIRGLKFYPGYEPFYPADACLRPYLELLVEFDLPALFHSGDTYSAVGGARLKYAHPLLLDDLAVDMPQLKIVMAHLGNPWVIDGQEICYKNPNVYADCSGFPDGAFDERSLEQFRTAVRRFTDDDRTRGKILFGTDWPIYDQVDYRRAVQATCGDDHAVFADNARRLYRLG